MSKILEEDNVQIAQLQQGERDLLDQLLKPEVQQSLTKLVELLPQLTEVLALMAKYADVVKSLATDERLKEDTIDSIKEIAGPVTDSVKKVAQTVVEAKDRAEEKQEVIGIFGLIKLLKDPQAQKLLRFMQAYLQVLQEKEGNKNA